jgi:hypothetical protein
MGRRAEKGSQLLGSMSLEAGRLKQTLDGFNGTISIFGTLGTLTRIETSRLGSVGADFGNLADDVKSLAGSVQARVEGALVAAALLVPPIAGAVRNISALEEEQAKDLPAVIEGALANLSRFREIQDRARDASLRLRTRYEAISEAFGRLIVSIQFHDITRQQVEHVMEALGRICQDAGESGGTHGQRDTAAVLALQSSQLADAGRKFAASVASLAHNLDEIAAHVGEMAEESRTLSGLSEDDKDSFFLEMERGCTAILASLGHCASSENATSSISGDLAENIGRMRGSIDEIEAMEIQVQRLAMNASISAAHIGAAGDALGVLAGAMEHLAADCRTRSDLLGESLATMSGAAHRLSSRGGDGGDAEGTAGDVSFVELRTAVADLHCSSERSFAQIAQIVARSARLREQLTATRNGLSAGEVFAEATGRAQGTLRKMELEQESRQARVDSRTSARNIADFAGNYTMQAERDVHEGMAGDPEMQAGEAVEVGDNVELF